MHITINLHPDRVEAVQHKKSTWLALTAGDGEARIFPTVAMCDEIIKAAVEAKRLLLGDDAPKPDLAAAEADPANPYGSTDPEHDAFWDAAKHGTPLASLREREHYQAAEPVIIVPFQHLPHLPQHVGGNPMCSLCGLDHYALHAIGTTGGA